MIIIRVDVFVQYHVNITIHSVTPTMQDYIEDLEEKYLIDYGENGIDMDMTGKDLLALIHDYISNCDFLSITQNDDTLIIELDDTYVLDPLVITCKIESK